MRQQEFHVRSLPEYGYVHQQRVSEVIRAFYVNSILDGSLYAARVPISQGLQ